MKVKSSVGSCTSPVEQVRENFCLYVFSSFLSSLAVPLDVIGIALLMLSLLFLCFVPGSSKVKLGFCEHTQCSQRGRVRAMESTWALVPLQPETNVLTL